jgi:undecaprenyl diphosphate synthase
MNQQAKRLPRHVAVIMDGNGRWARHRKLPRIEGHRAGVRAVRETVRACRELGIGYLTLYAFSVENWTRPRSEVSALMHLLRHYLNSEIDEMRRNGVRLRVIGDSSRLSSGVRKALEKAMRETANGTNLCLSLALSYGGRDEILRAARKFAQAAARGELAPDDLSEQRFGEYLDTADIPDPDLLIRTSGEQRVSNFLLWQIAYAELYVTPVLWPDFTKEDLVKAFEEYAGRERRFGGVDPDAAL